MNNIHRLSALLIGTTVVVAQPFNWGKATAGISIGKLAQDLTVFIQGVNNPNVIGSGVIISRSGKSYTVLTTSHVVAATDQYTVQVLDGEQYTLQNVRKLPNVDLATVQFESSRTYATAQLGNSDEVRLTNTVYISGFPSHKSSMFPSPTLAVTNGEIAQVFPANAEVNGYGLAYTNSTRAGMSGGPVFNAAGEVIAIHGRKADSGESNGAYVNLGIPINRYKTASLSGSQIASVSTSDTQQQEAAQRKTLEEVKQQKAIQLKAQEAATRQAQVVEATAGMQQNIQEKATLAALQQAVEDAERKFKESQRKLNELQQRLKGENSTLPPVRRKPQALAQIFVVNKSGNKVPAYRNSYALVISAGNYKYWSKLSNVEEESLKVVNALEEQGFIVTHLNNPNSDNFRNGFNDFIGSYGYDSDNRLVVFYTGHGTTRQKDKGYIVPVNAPDPNIDEHGFLKVAISMEQIISWAKQIEAKHVLFVFDSCFSGTIFKTKSITKPRESYIRNIFEKPVRQFIAAGDANEEIPAKSIFTPLFIQGITGEADFNKDGYVTGSELGLYLTQTLPNYTNSQTPQYGKIRDIELDQGDIIFQVKLK
jgi:hypothetical protein